MANDQIVWTGTPALTRYVRIDGKDGEVWNGTAMEAFALANILTYAQAMTESPADSGRYAYTVHADVPAGRYREVVCDQPLAAANEFDPVLRERLVDWNGTELQYLSVDTSGNAHSDMKLLKTAEADQAVADALKLAPTAGDPGVGSVNKHLDDILADTEVIGVLGAGLTDLGGMSTGMKAEVKSEAGGALTAWGKTGFALTSAYDAAKTAAAATSVAAIATIFTGITTLAKWLGIMAGKTADADTLAEINATTAGADYDNTKDSQEALRDRGDAAWITAAGFNVVVPPTKVEMVAAFTEIKGSGWLGATDTLEQIRNKVDTTTVPKNISIDVQNITVED